MKRTGAVLLVSTAFIGAVLGFGVDQVLTATSRPTVTPDYQLGLLLLAIGAAVLVFAWPIRSAVRAKSGKRVDPFRALRIAVLAKASSILGALIGGVSIGLGIFVLTRGVPAPVGSIVAIGFTAGASLVLVVAALVAEQFCTLPKDDDDEPTATDAASA